MGLHGRHKAVRGADGLREGGRRYEGVTEKEAAEANVGWRFRALERDCEVLRTATFSGTLHYGFITVDDKRPVIGWIPVDFIHPKNK